MVVLAMDMLVLVHVQCQAVAVSTYTLLVRQAVGCKATVVSCVCGFNCSYTVAFAYAEDVIVLRLSSPGCHAYATC